MDARTRSRGLTRVNRLTGWLAGGAVVASGAFVALLAHPHASSGAAGTRPPRPFRPTPGVTAPADTAPGATDSPPTTGDATTTLDPFNGSSSNGGGRAWRRPS